MQELRDRCKLVDDADSEVKITKRDLFRLIDSRDRFQLYFFLFLTMLTVVWIGLGTTH